MIYAFFHDYRVWRSYREWCQNDSICKFWSMNLTSMFVYPQVNELTFYVLFGITHISSTSLVPSGCWPILGAKAAEWPITHWVFACRYWLCFLLYGLLTNCPSTNTMRTVCNKWKILQLLLFAEIVATVERSEIHEMLLWHSGELLRNCYHYSLDRLATSDWRLHH